MRTFGAIASTLILSLTAPAFAREPAPGTAGAIRFTLDWSVEVASTPAPYLSSGPGVLILGLPGGELSGIDPSTGASSWTRTLPAPLAAAPLAADRRVAVVAGSTLHLLNLGDGAAVAAIPVGGPCHLSAEGARLAAACADGQFRLIDLENGATLWSHPLAASASAPAAFCGDLMLAASTGGVLEAVRGASGEALWSRALPGEITGQPACAGRRAWAGASDNRLHSLAIRMKRGRHRWSYLTGGDIAGGPRLAGDEILFFSLDSWLYALRPESGHLAWRVRLGQRPGGAALVDDLLFVAPLNGERLEAFRLPGGARAGWWDTEAGAERIVAPPIAAGQGVALAVARYGEETSRIVRLHAAADPEATPPTGSAR